MFLTLVPALIGFGEPFTGRFLMTMTESPFLSSFPFESTILRISASADSLGFHYITGVCILDLPHFWRCGDLTSNFHVT